MSRSSESRLSRRSTLKALGLGTTGVAMGLFNPVRILAQMSNRRPGNPLKIPELLTGITDGMEKRFELLLAPAEAEFFPGMKTPVLGINGGTPGPTLRYSRDDLIRFQVDNRLGEPTSLHWHGLHVPARSDGGPNQIFGHNERWNPLVKIMQQAGTFWYHSHMMHKTGEQVWRGLAGMMIIDDDVSRRLPLPDQYGVDDIPVMIQDRRFTESGELEYMTRYEDMVQGMQGDTILVNGTVSPWFAPSTSKVRLRILNAANARKFMLGFSDGREFQVIASDGGFLESPVSMNRLMLSSAERVEIVVDFSDGNPVTLVNIPMPSNYQDSPGAMSKIMRRMGTEAFDILHFYPEPELGPSAEIPPRLTHIERLQASQAAQTRHFRLQMGSGTRSGGDRGPMTGHRNGFGGGHGGGNYFINGRQMDINYINERVRLGDVEIWEIYNHSPMPHPFHVHSGQFQILDRDGLPPPPHEMGYKDTVLVKARETVRIIMHFTDFSDANVSYMYHCHMLEHEDRGMMGQFLVV